MKYKYLKSYSELNELHSDTYYSAAQKIKKEIGENDTHKSFITMGNLAKERENKKTHIERKYSRILKKEFPDKYESLSNRELTSDILECKFFLHINHLNTLFNKRSELCEPFFDLLSINKKYNLKVKEFFEDHKNILEVGNESRLNYTDLYMIIIKKLPSEKVNKYIKLLVDNSYDISSITYNPLDMSILQYIIGSSEIELAKYVLDSDLDLNINNQDISGNTALNYAVGDDNLDMVKKILEKGGDPYITDKNNRNQFFHPEDLSDEMNNFIKLYDEQKNNS